jgi:hypothetical protein
MCACISYGRNLDPSFVVYVYIYAVIVYEGYAVEICLCFFTKCRLD